METMAPSRSDPARSGLEPCAEADGFAHAVRSLPATPAQTDGGGAVAPAHGAAAVHHTARSAGADARRMVADGLVRSGGTATAADREAVAGHLAQTMSLDQLRRLAAAGVHFTASRGSVTDVLTKLRGVHPRGYPPGFTWDSVPGTVNPVDRHDVVVATRQGAGGTRVMPGPAQSSSADVALHEAGHAINRTRGAADLASDRPAFREAYDKDAGTGPLSGGYYHQADAAAGRDEAYAESHAMFLRDPRTMQHQSPHLFAYWQGFYAGGQP